MLRFLSLTVAVVVASSCSALIRTSHAQQMLFPDAEWERAIPESQFVHSILLQNAMDYLAAEMSGGGGVDACVVIRNGRVIWEGPKSSQSYHVWSVNKSFATTALGLLIDDGGVSLDTLAEKYLPSMATDYPDVTLRHLATHTSGYLTEGEGELYPLNPSRPESFPEDPFDPASPLFAPPGSQFAYSGYSAMDTMMNVLTRAAGEPMQDLFQRRIGDPIGLDPASWDWGHYQTVDGMVVDGGGGRPEKGIVISAEDLARVGHLFLNRGNWSGEQLLSSQWIDQATSAQVPASIPAHPKSPTWGPGVYGYGWWVNGSLPWGQPPFPGGTPETFAALGAFDNHMFVVPEWNMVVVREGDGQDDQPASTLGTFLRLIGFAIIPETGVVDVLPGRAYVTKDNMSDGVFDDLGDKAEDVWLRARGDVGERDSAGGNAVTRLVTKFSLPGGPDTGRAVQRATLRLFLEDIEGDPVGPVSIWHSVTDNDADLSPSDFEDETYTDTLLDLVQVADAGQQYYELDVTDLVLADYAADGNSPMSAFRLQVNEAEFYEDDHSHRYEFTMPGASHNPPEMVLTFIPEPSTFLLVAFGLPSLLGYALRRIRAVQ